MIDLSLPGSTERTSALVVPWPTESSIGGLLEFPSAEEWVSFLRQHDIHTAVPLIVAAKYQRAQRLYALAWCDFDLIKVGELIALTALELALKCQYGAHVPKRKKQQPMLPDLLRYMVEKDALTDDSLPFVQRCGGFAVAHLYETEAARIAHNATQSLPQMTLVGIRNSLAHGDPFDGLPWGGLLELIRDLIQYAYRDTIRSSSGSQVA